jgi:molybdopterin synthase sulfur carrier subunit
VKIELRFFAALRERLNIAVESVELPVEIRTVGEVRAWLEQRGDSWSDALGKNRNVRVALNRHMVKEDALLQEGAEVAFFPPVTGG